MPSVGRDGPLFAYFGPRLVAPLAFLGEVFGDQKVISPSGDSSDLFVSTARALRVYQAAPLLRWEETLAFLLGTKATARGNRAVATGPHSDNRPHKPSGPVPAPAPTPAGGGAAS